jgi:CBS-domain-containing membrane protein
MNTYTAMRSRPMRAGTIVRQPGGAALRAVTLADPAIDVMTDLKHIPAVPVDPDVPIDAAMRIMVRRGVRSLFVLDVEDEVIGLVTSTDLLGEKPLRHSHANGGRRSEVLVRHVMTPHTQLEVLPIAEVMRAQVGNVLATLRASRRQHAMVVEDGPADRQVVRGIFSASQLEAQLGTPVSPSVGVATFAEIRAVLSPV